MTGKSIIELVAFDLGNVLCGVDEEPVARHLASLASRDWEDVHKIVFSKEQKLLFESGKLTFAQHAQQSIDELGIEMTLEEFTKLYNSVLIPSEKMFPLVSRIGESHRLTLVSNTSEPHWISANKFLPFSAQLGPIIVSYEVESMKPESAFYEALLSQSGVAPGNILFVDDLAVNIEAAERAGMVGHQFTTPAKLEAVLIELAIF
jgi:FMN phosphatase YigB (HAD superfamily)